MRRLSTISRASSGLQRVLMSDIAAKRVSWRENITTWIYSERKSIVFVVLHFILTMTIWYHFFYEKFTAVEKKMAAADPEVVNRYWWKRLTPPRSLVPCMQGYSRWLWSLIRCYDVQTHSCQLGHHKSCGIHSIQCYHRNAHMAGIYSVYCYFCQYHLSDQKEPEKQATKAKSAAYGAVRADDTPENKL